MLRLLNSLSLALMLVFAGVQYNDPDALLWVSYYGVPAYWAFIAGYRPAVLALPAWWAALWASVAAWALLVALYWPPMPRFWVKAVWMEEETAREGMGLMVALAMLLLALASGWAARRRAPAAPKAWAGAPRS